MRVVVASVGKPKPGGLADAIREYEGRLAHYFKYESLELPAASLPDDRAEEARGKEAEAILRRLPAELALYALTRRGKLLSTRELAARLEEMATYGRPGAAFVIGGAHGLDPSVLARAEVELSLSKMTLPHELARLVLVEQLYRAGTILRGEPYHKGP